MRGVPGAGRVAAETLATSAWEAMVPKSSVSTRSGVVLGHDDGGVVAFLGIPYAAPPEGENRFRPPRPAPEWSGVRSADEFGPIPPQPTSGIGSYVPGDSLAQSEDCLYLNVWTPRPGRGRLPVMVYVHGGAFMNGAGSSVLYRPHRLAALGVVVVTINYRLGALGFLAHPSLADGESGGFGNWGLLDIVAALRWVSDNIAGFGGDPENVTLFGESAGATAVCDLLTVEAAHRLFKRVIVQSGAALASGPDASGRIAERLAQLLSISEPSREALVRVPSDVLVEAQRVLNGEVDGGIGLPFQPVIDGGLLREPPEDAIVAGASAGIDLLGGWNRDEFTLFSFGALVGKDLDAPGLEALIAGPLRGAGLDETRAKHVIDAYRVARTARGEPVGERALLDAILTDWIFRIPLVRLADAHVERSARTFLYEFDWPSPFAGGALGACHGIELPFVFGTVHDPLIALFAGSGDDAVRLCDAVQASWVAFASRGDPSNDLTGSWRVHQPERRSTMRLGAHIEAVDAPRDVERGFWERELGRYGFGGPIEGARRLGVGFLAPGEDHHSGA